MFILKSLSGIDQTNNKLLHPLGTEYLTNLFPRSSLSTSFQPTTPNKLIITLQHLRSSISLPKMC